MVGKHRVFLHVPVSLRLTVPPIPSQCMSGGFLIDIKSTAFMARHRPGNTIENQMHKLCLSAAGREKSYNLKR